MEQENAIRNRTQARNINTQGNPLKSMPYSTLSKNHETSTHHTSILLPSHTYPHIIAMIGHGNDSPLSTPGYDLDLYSLPRTPNPFDLPNQLHQPDTTMSGNAASEFRTESEDESQDEVQGVGGPALPPPVIPSRATSPKRRREEDEDQPSEHLARLARMLNMDEKDVQHIQGIICRPSHTATDVLDIIMTLFFYLTHQINIQLTRATTISQINQPKMYSEVLSAVDGLRSSLLMKQTT
jgi:hypothetical protein